MLLQDYLSHYDITEHQLLSFCEAAPTDSAVMLGGSLSEGFGTLESDLDLYVIVAAPLDSSHTHHFVTSIGSALRREVRFASGRRVDIKYIPSASLQALGLALETALSTTQLGCRLLPSETLEMCHRLLAGYPLRNEEALRAATRLAGITHERLSQYLVRLRSHDSLRAERYAYRKSGTLSEAIAARLALEAAADAILAAHGQTNTRFEKWRIRKTRALMPEHLWARELLACLIAPCSYGVPAVQVDSLGLDNPPAERVEIGA